MALRVYYQADVDPQPLRDATVSVIGYGNQGHAHALNLRDSGHRVLVGQRPSGPGQARAVADGFEPASIPDATTRGDLLIVALPDEVMADVYDAEIGPHLRPESPDASARQALGFVHGFNIRFELIVPPPHVDVVLVAPKGPGTLVRDAFLRGGGLTCFFGVHDRSSGTRSAAGDGASNAGGDQRTTRARHIALAWASAVGGGRGGMIETTFAQECEADLFGEQTVLCGGVIELMKAGFDVLVEAGFPPEVAYFECIHEVKQIVDLQYAEGLASMREKISNTAAYGGLIQGPRIVTDDIRQRLRTILAEIQSGAFARDWMSDCRSGRRRLGAMMKAESEHPSESAGRLVRDFARQALGDRAESAEP